MGQVKLSIEELIGLVRGELPTEEVKQNLANALLDAWINNPDVSKKIEERAEELAERKIKQLMKSAFNETQPTSYNGNKRTFNGWASAIIENCFNEAMKTAGLATGNGQTIRAMAEDVVRNYGDDYRRSWQKTLDDMKPLVDEEVRKLIPQYVTAEYKERVAANFDDKKMPALLEEMVTKAIGGMLMSGALSFNVNGTQQS